MSRVNTYISALKRIFQTARDKHDANIRCRPVLEDMSGDAPLLREILSRNIGKSGALDARHYPVIALEIEVNPAFTLVANCWIPLPDRRADVSTKSIHHHGNMLLSTVTAFGPGYEHWTFSCPSVVAAETELFEMKLLDRAPHPLHHVGFVDSFIAHLPFYPSATSVTYALWTNKFPVTWRDYAKRIPLLQRNRDALKRLANKAGLKDRLDLKIVDYFDFYPSADGFRGLRLRTEFERGPNEDYLHSLFHLIQVTGNEGLAGMIEAKLAAEGAENPALVRKLLSDLRAGRPIEGRLSPMHYNIAGANFTRAEIEAALLAQGVKMPATTAVSTC